MLFPFFSAKKIKETKKSNKTKKNLKSLCEAHTYTRTYIYQQPFITFIIIIILCFVKSFVLYFKYYKRIYIKRILSTHNGTKREQKKKKNPTNITQIKQIR